jgi:hypothetical protein
VGCLLSVSLAYHTASASLLATYLCWCWCGERAQGICKIDNGDKGGKGGKQGWQARVARVETKDCSLAINCYGMLYHCYQMLLTFVFGSVKNTGFYLLLFIRYRLGIFSFPTAYRLLSPPFILLNGSYLLPCTHAHRLLSRVL